MAKHENQKNRHVLPYRPLYLDMPFFFPIFRHSRNESKPEFHHDAPDFETGQFHIKPNLINTFPTLIIVMKCGGYGFFLY